MLLQIASSEELNRATGKRVLVALAIWGLIVAAAAQSGLLRTIYPPLIAPIVAAGIVVPLLVYFRSRRVRGYVEVVGLRRLTALHVWRIPAAGLFFWYGAHDLLPPVFVRHAAWGDLIAGVLALLAVVSREARWKYWTFHVIGFADFVLAVGTGLTMTLLHDPRMDPIRALPLALIPLYGVGISGATHVIAFDLLCRGKGLRATEER